MLNIAHRGASGHAPENTLDAIVLGRRLGAHRVEVDVRLAGDGQPVLLHDATLTRTAEVDAHVSDLTSADLALLGVPTLREAASAAPLLVEIKDPAEQPGLVAAVVDAVRDQDVVLQSFDADAVRECAVRAPHVPRALLGRPRPADLREISAWAGGVNVHHLRADADLVAAAHAAGMTCGVWTVNRPRSLRRVAALGVDAVISDYPDRVVAHTGAWCPAGSVASTPSAASTLGSSALAVRR